MSESMAFVGGVAVAGLAALVLLKGTGTPAQPNFTVAPPMPPNVMTTPMMPQSGYYQQPYINPQPTAPSGDQRVEMESLKAQLERLKSDNEQLKIQNQQLQWQFQNQQQNQLFAQQNNQRAILQPQNEWWSSPVLWLVGGMTLTIGGGVVVAGVLALFSPKQRPTRTVRVIPYHSEMPTLIPARRTKFLPPRAETRRMGTAEYDEMR